MDVLDGLNPEQRRAAEAVRGPVCILAGAGSGKTTTITRRIANQVATGAFAPARILAVTFTDKAAGEMRSRLEALGSGGVAARTFHSAALAQLRHFAGPDGPGKILSSKALMLRQIGNSLPRAYRFRPAGDLATEIEWAKARRLTPETYERSLDGHEPPIPADLMRRVFRDYEHRKVNAGLVDFEDLLEHTVRLYDANAEALAVFRDRYRAFTVDEYQDVNDLQQALLDRWLGDRDELCAVGDDYQAIYSFTGASPAHLLGMPARFPHATVVRLEENYRSTPQVLELANRLAPKLGGAAKELRAACAAGPEPIVQHCADEAGFVVSRIRELHADGIAHEEMAVLVRTNARTADFEEALHDAAIPFQGASLLDRDAARSLLKRLGGNGGSAAVEVRRLALDQGWLDDPPEKLGERELTRQTDLGRLIRLAEESGLDVPAFVEDLRERFGPSGEAKGVHLLTLHRAKGLEFDAVFLPRVEEKELPIRQAKDPVSIGEERRLLYVGMTRARTHLSITWSGKPSRFLAELGIAARAPERRAVEDQPPAFHALREWRLERSKADEIPAYVVFHNATLEEIAARRPATLAELGLVPGVGPTKLERYGPEVLAALAAAP